MELNVFGNNHIYFGNFRHSATSFSGRRSHRPRDWNRHEIQKVGPNTKSCKFLTAADISDRINKDAQNFTYVC